MGEAAVTIARWTLKFSFFTSLVLATLVLIGVVTSYFIVGLNQSILGDIFGLIQIWLPFNLNILLIWITIATTSYLAFRLSLMAFNMLDSYLGK